MEDEKGEAEDGEESDQVDKPEKREEKLRVVERVPCSSQANLNAVGGVDDGYGDG